MTQDLLRDLGKWTTRSNTYAIIPAAPVDSAKTQENCFFQSESAWNTTPGGKDTKSAKSAKKRASSMSLLLPDYSSSSSDDEKEEKDQGDNKAPPSLSSLPPPPVAGAVPPKPSSPAAAIASLELPPPSRTSKRRRPLSKKKPKTALFLHPTIQRLLAGGGGEDDSDEDDDSDSLLAKQRRAKAVATRVQTASAPRGAGDGSTLTFLPPPKHAPAPADDGKESMAVGNEEATPVEAQHQHQQQQPQQQQQEEVYYDEAQYAQYYAYYQQQQEQQAFQSGEETLGSSSKRARHRERDLERALQQGDFARVAAEIVEVRGPAPSAWAPPAASVHEDPDRPSTGEVKVQASFWNAQAGARVATVKPNRMQRQKHQLNQLAFDAKMREHELLDRKGASLKTKAETHAKYGW